MSPTTMLFIPADRPERFEKPVAMEADAIILDLEDAVAPERRDRARQNLRECRIRPDRVYIRINPAATDDCRQDLAALPQTPFRNIVLPKAEDPSVLHQIVEVLGDDTRVVPLIETAVGLDNARGLAMHEAVPFLAFGSLDFALDLGCEHTPEALLHARHLLVFQSRMAKKSPPIDGVTADINDNGKIRADALRAKELGFAGKLLIHPRQIETVNAVFRPSEKDVAWAHSIVRAVAAAGTGAVQVDGQMVDRPVLIRAERILCRNSTAKPR